MNIDYAFNMEGNLVVGKDGNNCIVENDNNIIEKLNLENEIEIIENKIKAINMLNDRIGNVKKNRGILIFSIICSVAIIPIVNLFIDFLQNYLFSFNILNNIQLLLVDVCFIPIWLAAAFPIIKTSINDYKKAKHNNIKLKYLEKELHKRKIKLQVLKNEKTNKKLEPDLNVHKLDTETYREKLQKMLNILQEVKLDSMGEYIMMEDQKINELMIDNEEKDNIKKLIKRK